MIKENIIKIQTLMKEKGIDVENLNVEEILSSNDEETTEVIGQNAEVPELKAENEIIEKTGDYAVVDQQPKLDGKIMSCVLVPKKDK